MQEERITRLKEELTEWKNENFGLFSMIVYAITHSEAKDILYAYNYALRTTYLRTYRQLPYWNATLTSLLPYRSSSQLRRHFLHLILKKEIIPKFTFKLLMNKRSLDKALMAWLLVDEGVYGRSLLTHVMLMSGMDKWKGLFLNRRERFQEEAIHNGMVLGYDEDFWLGECFTKITMPSKERIAHLCKYYITKA